MINAQTACNKIKNNVDSTLDLSCDEKDEKNGRNNKAIKKRENENDNDKNETNR